MAKSAGSLVTKGAQVSNLIERIVRCVNDAETTKSPYAFIEARRLLNNELPQAVDQYVLEEKEKVCADPSLSFPAMSMNEGSMEQSVSASST